jgi:hypothetical protein
LEKDEDARAYAGLSSHTVSCPNIPAIFVVEFSVPFSVVSVTSVVKSSLNSAERDDIAEFGA